MANNIGYTFGLRPDYTVGNIVLTAGSKNFTVTNGANLQIANILPGFTILHPNGKVLVIENVTNATSGTLRDNCPADCGGTIRTTIRYQSDNSSLSAAVRDLLGTINSGLLYSISSLSMTKGMMIVGDEVAGTAKLVDMGRLENIRALTLSANQIIVGNGGNAVKAVTLNTDSVTATTTNQYVTAAEKTKITNAFQINIGFGDKTANDFLQDGIYYGQSASWTNVSKSFPETSYGTFEVFNLIPNSKDRTIQRYTTHTGNLWLRFVSGTTYGPWINLNHLNTNNKWTGTNTFNNAVTFSGNLTANTANLTNTTVTGKLTASAENLTNLFVGGVVPFPAINAPTGWLKANGALVSRATYPLLWAFAQASGALVSETEWANGRQGCFSTGNGTSTFRLPDYRGEFLRGLDDGRGVDAGRTIGSAQGDAIRNITGAIHALWALGQATEGAFSSSLAGTNRPNAGGDTGQFSYYFDASRIVPTATENRPRNIALLACIRYQ